MLMSPRGMLDRHNIRRRGPMKSLYWNLCENAGVQALDGIHFLDETEQDGAAWAMRRDKPAIIQPNGLDLDHIAGELEAERSAKGSPFPAGDEAHLVFLGRLNVIKGLEMQVDLMADLRGQGVRARLHLIGPDDGERERLLRHAAQAGVSDAVELHGPIYGHDRLRWLHDADAVLMTSHYECNSNTAAETMGVGGLLVATDTCHLNKAGAGGAAVVVPRERTAVRDAVLTVLRDRLRAQAIRARSLAHAKAQLDWRALGEDMLSFYRTLLDRRSLCAA
jgi:glycosyltransferase involved in cell wall biosynthesis